MTDRNGEIVMLKIPHDSVVFWILFFLFIGWCAGVSAGLFIALSF